MSVSHPSDATLRLKILSPKQMIKRLPMVIPLVKAGNISENVLNATCQIICYLYQAKEILKIYITI